VGSAKDISSWDAERAIAWRAADSFAVLEFLGLVLPEAPPDPSTISRTRRLIDLETHEASVARDKTPGDSVASQRLSE
jgi:hypothetical protein